MTRSALQNAASVAGLLLTTEVARRRQAREEVRRRCRRGRRRYGRDGRHGWYGHDVTWRGGEQVIPRPPGAYAGGQAPWAGLAARAKTGPHARARPRRSSARRLGRPCRPGSCRRAERGHPRATGSPAHGLSLGVMPGVFLEGGGSLRRARGDVRGVGRDPRDPHQALEALRLPPGRGQLPRRPAATPARARPSARCARHTKRPGSTPAGSSSPAI